MSGGTGLPLPQAKRDGVHALRRSGMSVRAIAATLDVSIGWVHGVLAEAGEAAEATTAAAGGAAPPEPVPAPTADAAASPADGSSAASAAPAAGADVAEEIGRLTKDLAQLRVLVSAPGTDPGTKVRGTATIGQISSRLAMLRKEQRAVTAPERDASIMRAGQAAADRFRRLLEEAIGEAAAEEA